MSVIRRAALRIHRKAQRRRRRFRETWYRLLLAECGERLSIHGRVSIVNPNRIRIGDRCGLNEGVLLNARAPITIGSNCQISAYTAIHSTGMDLTFDGDRRASHVAGDVRIGDGVWVASHVVIGPGVTIGESSVIAAGSVVLSDIPAGVLAGGAPARVLRKLEAQELPDRFPPAGGS